MDSSATELSEEIGAYGTGLSETDSADADDAYENTFSDDPGHISRAEIRFNAALRAAGVRTTAPSKTVRKPALRAAPAPAQDTSSTEWTAFPDPSEGRKKEEVTVNLYGYGDKPTAAAPAATAPSRSRLGMSSREAQKDLLGYFDTLDNQIHDEERKHAKEVLTRLGGSGGSQTKLSQAQPQQKERRHSRGRNRENSIMRLLRKAMESDEFKNQIASLADNDS